MIMMAITHAKMGRLMKNRGIGAFRYFLGPAAGGISGDATKGTAMTGVPGRAL
jgi:hypothetical protein